MALSRSRASLPSSTCPSARRWPCCAHGCARARTASRHGQRGFQLAPHAVVVDHILGIGRQRGGGARWRRRSTVYAAHDEGLAARDELHFIGQQGLQEGDSAGVGRQPRASLQRSHPVIAFTTGNGDGLSGTARVKSPGSNRPPSRARQEDQTAAQAVHAKTDVSRAASQAKGGSRSHPPPPADAVEPALAGPLASLAWPSSGGSAERRFGGELPLLLFGSSFLPLFSGMKGLQGSAFTGPLVFHTTLNWPSALISPMNTGLCRWWFFSSMVLT